MGDIKTFNLNQLRERCNIGAFVETGTLYGDGVQFALESGFTEVHSIEIMEGLAHKAIDRFRHIPFVKIHHGHSADVLSRLKFDIRCNAFFWLDAHFPGGDSNEKKYDAEINPDVRTPLEHEIRHIADRSSLYRDALIIDDLWLYEDGPFEWGSFDEHQKRCNRSITRAQLLAGKDADFIYSAFYKTHTIKKFYQHQGYVVILPK